MIMPLLRRVTALMLIFLAPPLLAQTAAAQAWPTRPVHMVVAGASGSAPDVIARIIGNRLVETWGQQIIVDNKPGAAGNLGTEAAAHAPADGYTLLFGQAAPLSMNRFVFKTLPFDVDRDFVPVVNVGLSPMMIAANPRLPANTIGELIDLAKAQPGKLSFGTSSSRNIPHLTGELLKRAGGFEMTHVSYRANTQAIQDVITGETQLMIDGIPVLLNQVKDGRLKALAVSSAKRLPGLETVPTVAETLPGFVTNGWFAVLAPAGTPREVVARVNRDVNAVLRNDAVRDRMRDLGVYAEGGTPEELARFMRADATLWERIVRQAGIEPE